MPLRQRQLDALAVLEWLNDPTVRASGRSVALAVAAIRTACRNPGSTIDIVDHARPQVARENLTHLIRDMVRADPRLAPHWVIAVGGTTFSLGLPRPIPDWMPSEAVLSGRAAAELGRAAGERLRDDEMQRLNPRHDIDPEMEMVTPEMAERLDLDLAAAMMRRPEKPNEVPEVQRPLKKPKVPQPKSAWDRLLADEDD